MVQPNPVTLAFNPTATAMQFNGSNEEAVRNHLETRTTKAFDGKLENGKYYAAFMGEVFVLDEAQLRAAMGRV